MQIPVRTGRRLGDPQDPRDAAHASGALDAVGFKHPPAPMSGKEVGAVPSSSFGSGFPPVGISGRRGSSSRAEGVGAAKVDQPISCWRGRVSDWTSSSVALRVCTRAVGISITPGGVRLVAAGFLAERGRRRGPRSQIFLASQRVRFRRIRARSGRLSRIPAPPQYIRSGLRLPLFS